MQWFRNLSLKLKLNGGFGAVLTIFLTLTLVLLAALDLSTRLTQALSAVDNMYIDIQQVELTLNQYQLRNDSGWWSIDAARKDWLKNSATARGKLFGGDTGALVTESDQRFDAYLAAVKKFVTLGADQVSSPQSYQDVVDARQALVKVMDELRIAKPQKIQAAIGRIKIALAGLSLMVVALGFYLAFRLARMIAGDMRKSVEFVSEVAAGNLRAGIDIVQNDEIGQLAEAMRGMARQLDEMVRQVRQGAEVVDGGASEVRGNSETLARRAGEQAVGVERIAATIEEMSGSIKAAAQQAADGRGLALAAAALVERNAERSREMASAMDAITDAAGQIREITATVNEVAFQTNLLALNAAVEAARAGEHGKGFAVVAAEVRALAQRSAEASREIKGLVETAVASVASGSVVVKEVAEAMGAINQTTVELTLAMDEIAAASNAQAAGVDELNIAVEQVDEGTQNSVAIARDLADSAAAMQHSAAAMLEIMGAFKTGASRTEAVSRTGREEKQPAAVLRPQRLAA